MQEPAIPGSDPDAEHDVIGAARPQERGTMNMPLVSRGSLEERMKLVPSMRKASTTRGSWNLHGVAIIRHSLCWFVVTSAS